MKKILFLLALLLLTCHAHADSVAVVYGMSNGVVSPVSKIYCFPDVPCDSGFALTGMDDGSEQMTDIPVWGNYVFPSGPYASTACLFRDGVPLTATASGKAVFCPKYLVDEMFRTALQFNP